VKIKHNQDRPNQIQKYNFMQNVFFEKRYMRCTKVFKWGLRQSPQKLGEITRIFELKVTLQSVRLLSPVGLRCRKNGEQDALLAPPIILLGSS